MLLANQESIALLLLIPVAIVIYIFAIKWLYRRTDQVMERWSRETGFSIVSREFRWLSRGPFWLTASRGQSVYRIEALDAHGMYHTGWMRIGGWFLGILSDQVEVIWDHRPEGFPVVIPPKQRDEDGTKR